MGQDMQEINHVSVECDGESVIIRQFCQDFPPAVVVLHRGIIPLLIRMLRREIAEQKDEQGNGR